MVFSLNDECSNLRLLYGGQGHQQQLEDCCVEEQVVRSTPACELPEPQAHFVALFLVSPQVPGE